MKRLKEFFTRIQMLGAFGAIMLAAIAILGTAIYYLETIESKVVEIEERSLKSSLILMLDNSFLNQQLAERSYALEADPAIIEEFNQSSDTLAEDIQEFKELSESQEDIDQIADIRMEVREDFENIVSQIDSGRMTSRLLDEIFLEDTALDQTLHKMIFEAEVLTGIAYDEGVELIEESSLIVIIGMALFPFLAVWAYFTAQRLTSPLLRITNVIMAAKGSRYDKNQLEEIIDRRDSIGQLAQAVDEMVQAAEERKAQLEKELEDLTQELRENRRHKLIRTPVTKRNN